MKRISLYFMLGAVALMAASCDTGDYADWADPQSSQPGDAPAATVTAVASNEVFDFENEQPDSITIFTPTVTAPAGATTTYDLTFYNADASEWIIMEGLTSGKIASADLEYVVSDLYGGKREQRSVPISIIAYTNIDGQTVRNTVTGLNVQAILKNSEADIWYLTGSCIADGTWGNSQIGVNVIPLYPDASDVTKLRYVGYLDNSGFKLIHKVGSWDEQWGMSGGNLVKNDGGSGNITLPGDPGYYEIVYNTASDNITITPYNGTVSVFTTITMPGSHQGWDAASGALTAMSTKVENHDWVTDLTITEDAQLKFANGSWDVNWGAETFPYGSGVNNGANINVPAGSYTVCFNDITGQYLFITK